MVGTPELAVRGSAAAVDRTQRAVVRLGAVSYLNAAPLVYGLEGDGRFRVERDVPSRVAERLCAGQVDLGMIPSIEYARGDSRSLRSAASRIDSDPETASRASVGGYAIVPDVAIVSCGPVRSVNLYLRCRLENVRRVALDRSSRTSVALLRILLAERLSRDVEYLEMPPSVPAMLDSADAALVIGDAALYYDGPAERLDLGEAWHQLTNLPFVWAFWAGRPDALDAAGVARLQQALAAGLAAVPQIAASYNPNEAVRNESYLRDNISYRFAEPERRGLLEFYRRAHALRLIPNRPELRFYGDRA
jgi:chorismate dehydratase